MNLLACLIPLVCAAVVSVSGGGGCYVYGHSCLGAHGKRSSWSPDESGVPFDEPDLAGDRLDALSIQDVPADERGPARQMARDEDVPPRFAFGGSSGSDYDD